MQVRATPPIGGGNPVKLDVEASKEYATVIIESTLENAADNKWAWRRYLNSTQPYDAFYTTLSKADVAKCADKIVESSKKQFIILRARDANFNTGYKALNLSDEALKEMALEAFHEMAEDEQREKKQREDSTSQVASRIGTVLAQALIFDLEKGLKAADEPVFFPADRIALEVFASDPKRVPQGYVTRAEVDEVIPSLAKSMKDRGLPLVKRDVLLKSIAARALTVVRESAEALAIGIEEHSPSAMQSLLTNPASSGYDLLSTYKSVATLAKSLGVTSKGWSMTEYEAQRNALKTHLGAQEDSGRALVKAFGRKRVEELTRKKIVNKKGILQTVLTREGDLPPKKQLHEHVSGLFSRLTQALTKRGHSVAHEAMDHLFRGWSTQGHDSVQGAAKSLLDHIHGLVTKRAQKPVAASKKEQAPRLKEKKEGSTGPRKATSGAHISKLSGKALRDIIHSLTEIAGLKGDEAMKYHSLVGGQEDGQKEVAPPSKMGGLKPSAGVIERDKKPTFKIKNLFTGETKSYEAWTETAALDAMARDNGYKSHDEMERKKGAQEIQVTKEKSGQRKPFDSPMKPRPSDAPKADRAAYDAQMDRRHVDSIAAKVRESNAGNSAKTFMQMSKLEADLRKRGETKKADMLNEHVEAAKKEFKESHKTEKEASKPALDAPDAPKAPISEQKPELSAKDSADKLNAKFNSISNAIAQEKVRRDAAPMNKFASISKRIGEYEDALKSVVSEAKSKGVNLVRKEVAPKPVVVATPKKEPDKKADFPRSYEEELESGIVGPSIYPAHGKFPVPISEQKPEPSAKGKQPTEDRLKDEWEAAIASNKNIHDPVKTIADPNAKFISALHNEFPMLGNYKDLSSDELSKFIKKHGGDKASSPRWAELEKLARDENDRMAKVSAVTQAHAIAIAQKGNPRGQAKQLSDILSVTKDTEFNKIHPEFRKVLEKYKDAFDKEATSKALASGSLGPEVDAHVAKNRKAEDYLPMDPEEAQKIHDTLASKVRELRKAGKEDQANALLKHAMEAEKGVGLAQLKKRLPVRAKEYQDSINASKIERDKAKGGDKVRFTKKIKEYEEALAQVKEKASKYGIKLGEEKPISITEQKPEPSAKGSVDQKLLDKYEDYDIKDLRGKKRMNDAVINSSQTGVEKAKDDARERNNEINKVLEHRASSVGSVEKVIHSSADIHPDVKNFISRLRLGDIEERGGAGFSQSSRALDANSRIYDGLSANDKKVVDIAISVFGKNAHKKDKFGLPKNSRAELAEALGDKVRGVSPEAAKLVARLEGLFGQFSPALDSKDALEVGDHHKKISQALKGEKFQANHWSPADGARHRIYFQEPSTFDKKGRRQDGEKHGYVERKKGDKDWAFNLNTDAETEKKIRDAVSKATGPSSESSKAPPTPISEQKPEPSAKGSAEIRSRDEIVAAALAKFSGEEGQTAEGLEGKASYLENASKAHSDKAVAKELQGLADEYRGHAKTERERPAREKEAAEKAKAQVEQKTKEASPKRMIKTPEEKAKAASDRLSDARDALRTAEIRGASEDKQRRLQEKVLSAKAAHTDAKEKSEGAKTPSVKGAKGERAFTHPDKWTSGVVKRSAAVKDAFKGKEDEQYPKASQRGVWAIHRLPKVSEKSDPKYQVTHAPSGMSLMTFDKAKDAKEALNRWIDEDPSRAYFAKDSPHGDAKAIQPLADSFAKLGHVSALQGHVHDVSRGVSLEESSRKKADFVERMARRDRVTPKAGDSASYTSAYRASIRFSDTAEKYGMRANFDRAEGNLHADLTRADGSVVGSVTLSPKGTKNTHSMSVSFNDKATKDEREGILNEVKSLSSPPTHYPEDSGRSQAAGKLDAATAAQVEHISSSYVNHPAHGNSTAENKVEDAKPWGGYVIRDMNKHVAENAHLTPEEHVKKFHSIAKDAIDKYHVDVKKAASHDKGKALEERNRADELFAHADALEKHGSSHSLRVAKEFRNRADEHRKLASTLEQKADKAVASLSAEHKITPEGLVNEAVKRQKDIGGGTAVSVYEQAKGGSAKVTTKTRSAIPEGSDIKESGLSKWGDRVAIVHRGAVDPVTMTQDIKVWKAKTLGGAPMTAAEHGRFVGVSPTYNNPDKPYHETSGSVYHTSDWQPTKISFDKPETYSVKLDLGNMSSYDHSSIRGKLRDESFIETSNYKLSHKDLSTAVKAKTLKEAYSKLKDKQQDELYELVRQEGNVGSGADDSAYESAWSKLKSRGFYSDDNYKKGIVSRRIKFIVGRDGEVTR